jgi:Fur family ferric uptake transcriptional regulator
MTAEGGAVAGPGLPDLPATLRARGYRITPQRQLVLDAVTALEHGTPDEICAEVQRTAHGVNVNLSTVYRTLELLEELGLVTHTHLGHGAPTYHAAADSDHLHLVCRDCGAVIETDVALADSLVGMLAQRHGFETDVGHFAIYGRCQECAP